MHLLHTTHVYEWAKFFYKYTLVGDSYNDIEFVLYQIYLDMHNVLCTCRPMLKFAQFAEGIVSIDYYQNGSEV